MKRRAPAAAVLIVVVTLAAIAYGQGQAPSVESADKLFEDKNYREAADTYKEIVEAQGTKWRYAAEKQMQSLLRLNLYDDALDAAQDYVKRTAGTPYEARAERLLGNLYMSLPHWGTRAGGEFYRGEYRQGMRLQTWRYDKKHGVQHMERARELYAMYDAAPEKLAVLPEDERKGWHAERIDCIFDLANMVSQFSIYSDQPHFWHMWWGERDDFLAETAGEDDFDEGYSWQQWSRKRPIGLRVDADGRPIWPQKPDEYADDLNDDEKILYLLAEVRVLDETKNKAHTALSYYRQGMLARKRFGMDRLNGYAGNYYVDGRRPLQEELQSFNPWELEDGEALILAGGKLMVVELPEQFDVFGLLRTVYNEFADGGVADQARYGAGLYYQTRQQYNAAIEEYKALQAAFPQSDWTGEAGDQIELILKPQVRISQSSIHLPGKPAELQFSYRNVSKVNFVARRIDLGPMLKELHALATDATDNTWSRYSNALQSWHQPYSWQNLAQQRRYNGWWLNIAGRHLKEVVTQWTEDVEDDGSHRYAQAVRATRFTDRGAYLVYAFTGDIPQDVGKGGDAGIEQGDSRSVMVLTDVALVEKYTDKGKLYFVADAGSGTPLSDATINVLEMWTTYDRQKRQSVYHHKTAEVKTDKDGLTVYEYPKDRNQWSQVYTLVDLGEDRLAWTGMGWWRRYSPSSMQNGWTAYAFTDRPVYRPEQTVHMKAWIRHTLNGQYTQLEDYGKLNVQVHDPRGNKVHDITLQADQYGGIDSEFSLSAEPTLGMYQMQVRRGTNYIGGIGFRVEEYKKPEFEVTIEPDTDLAKLGAKVSAVIKARYYFGAPVTDAKVDYKVFREEYTHSWYPVGRWDWLYGAGYGYTWYDYDWFPWWGHLRSYCISPPWWGYRGNPVRELVSQGTARVDAEGKVHVDIDTTSALQAHGDRDHRYVITADVTDASRRTITGEGSVKVTRQAFYAYISTQGGYFQPDDDIAVTIKCVTPNGKPVEAEGVVTVSRVVFGGPDNARIEETELERFTAATDSKGEFTFKRRYGRSGQLKIEFAAPDRWGGRVTGHGLVWIVGRDFDGTLYRFNDLELVTDKRTYEPGDVCHLMINTKQAGSYVLFADEVDNGALLNYRMLNLPQGHTVVEVPIGKTSKPNFFVEATTVSKAQVHQEMRNILVPPEEGVMDVAVKFDKTEYKPGEEAIVHVNATLPDGSPAQGAQFALSAFDQSVLYIQPELAGPIAGFFHGRTRNHYQWHEANLRETFATMGYVNRPFQQIGATPPGWYGTWNPAIGNWSELDDEGWAQLGGRELQGGGGGGLGRGAALRQNRAVLADGIEGAPADADAAKGAMEEAESTDGMADEKSGASSAAGGMAEADVRQQFADTALWLASLVTGPDGTATYKFSMPENLTTWKLNTWGMTQATRVGQSSTSAVTTKNLLVRLQAPRFFVETDEVVISANVHNYLSGQKTANVSLDIPDELMGFMEGYSPTQTVTVAPNGETRVDWRIKVRKEGTAQITVKALTDEESDAMQMAFPVFVHGMLKQDSYTGSIRPDDPDTVRTIELTVPDKRKPEQSRLVVQYTPTLAGAMMDALPYCLDYPYRSSDATVYRFVPAVLTLKTLKNMGIELEDVKNIRGRLDEAKATGSYCWNPIFDSDEMHEIIQSSLHRIAKLQNNDGGWGWFETSSSSEWFTASVLDALLQAEAAGVQVDANMIQRGMNYLQQEMIQDVNRQTPPRGEKRKWRVGNYLAFEAYVLGRKDIRVKHEEAGDLVDAIFADRDKLSLYGKALLAMTLADLKDADRANLVLRNIMQYREDNDETELTWFRTPQQGWWYWWNNDIETNAWVLRAIVRIDPRHDAGPRLVKWLLENRRNGYYWRSVRDTAQCVAALSDFAAATGETEPNYTLTIDLDDGAVVKQVKITKDNFFTYDNQFVLEGVALTGGKHKVKITKDGQGALYYNAWLRYFTLEDHITASGLQLKVDRSYRLLRQIPFEVEVETATGAKIMERRLRYERIELKDGDKVESGDIIQVELRVTSDNEYTYVIFEDMKPAGCEPVALRSGGEGQEGFWSYMELRDEKVAFFVNDIGRGEHLLRYRLRAEIPGVFHALPSVVQAMYVPELRGNADEFVLKIEDTE